MLARILTSITVLCPLCAVLSSQEPMKRPSDSEITKLVIGKWKQDRKIGDIEMKFVHEFFQDGTWKSNGTAKFGDKEKNLAFTGTWKIRDRFLVQIIETSDPPSLKKGHEFKDEILSISKDQMKCKTKLGDEIIKIRVASDKK